MVFRLNSEDMIDITMSIVEDMKTYKNRSEKRPLIKGAVKEKPSYLSESTIKMSLHTGTHVDFPRHIMSHGKTSSDYLLDWTYFYDATVIEIPEDIKEISRELLLSLNIPQDRVILFKTDFSRLDSSPLDFPYISEDGAKLLFEKKARLVGIDSLGIERNQSQHETHNILLSNDILIIEGLNLRDVSSGDYRMFLSPMHILDVEAVPVSAYLFKK